MPSPIALCLAQFAATWTPAFRQELLQDRSSGRIIEPVNDQPL